jgi:hypothetical protein
VVLVEMGVSMSRAPSWLWGVLSGIALIAVMEWTLQRPFFLGLPLPERHHREVVIGETWCMKPDYPRNPFETKPIRATIQEIRDDFVQYALSSGWERSTTLRTFTTNYEPCPPGR